MQLAHYEACTTRDGIQQELARLQTENSLTARQAEAVDAEKILALFSSELGKRILNAKNLRREFKFSILTDAADYVPAAAGEEVLLQGVVDCAFETPSGLVVVDFKTDRVTPQQQSQRAEGYRPQLEAYALALGKVLEKDVSEKLLYFFHTNSTVKL